MKIRLKGARPKQPYRPVLHLNHHVTGQAPVMAVLFSSSMFLLTAINDQRSSFSKLFTTSRCPTGNLKQEMQQIPGVTQIFAQIHKSNLLHLQISFGYLTALYYAHSQFMLHGMIKGKKNYE
jgi:hypothetical protein